MGYFMLLAGKENHNMDLREKNIFLEEKGVSLTVVKHYKLCQYNMIMLMICHSCFPVLGRVREK